MADLIAVLDHGQLTECGTHRELMTARGLYAELFTLQACAYGNELWPHSIGRPTALS